MSVPEVSAAVDGLAAAILAGDRVALDALLDTDFEFVSAQARVVDRERRLATLAAGPEVLADFTFGNVHIRVFGDVAVVRADFSAAFRPHTGRPEPDRGVSTLVFSRAGGRWLLCHQHNSHLA